MVAHWRSGRLTDTVVTVGDRTFTANKNVLAGGSDYFDRHYDHGHLRDADNPKLVEHVAAAAFEPLLAFLYEGACTFDETLLAPVLQAAHYLGVAPLERAAVVALTERLSPSNALAVWTWGEELELPELAEAAKVTALKGFDAVESFEEATLEQVLALVADDRLSAQSEEAVFSAVARFAEAKQPAEADLLALLRNVRFPLMSEEFFHGTVRTWPMGQGLFADGQQPEEEEQGEGEAMETEEDGGGEEEEEEEELGTLKVAELKERLRSRGLDETGKKAALRARLQEAIREAKAAKAQPQPQSRNHAAGTHVLIRSSSGRNAHVNDVVGVVTSWVGITYRSQKYKVRALTGEFVGKLLTVQHNLLVPLWELLVRVHVAGQDFVGDVGDGADFSSDGAGGSCSELDGYQFYLQKYTKQYHIEKAKNSGIKWQPEEAWRQLDDKRRAKWEARANAKKKPATELPRVGFGGRFLYVMGGGVGRGGDGCASVTFVQSAPWLSAPWLSGAVFDVSDRVENVFYGKGGRRLLYSHEPAVRHKLNALMTRVHDMMAARLVMQYWTTGLVSGSVGFTTEVFATVRRDWFKTTLPLHLAYFDDQLKASKTPYFADAPSATVPDLFVACHVKDLTLLVPLWELGLEMPSSLASHCVRVYEAQLED